MSHRGTGNRRRGGAYVPPPPDTPMTTTSSTAEDALPPRAPSAAVAPTPSPASSSAPPAAAAGVTPMSYADKLRAARPTSSKAGQIAIRPGYGTAVLLPRAPPAAVAPTPSPASSSAPPAAAAGVTWIPIATRPGCGTAGKKYRVRTNHLGVRVDEGQDHHKYLVHIQPEVTLEKVKRNVVCQLLESKLGKRKTVFDGKDALYTAGPLPFESEESVVELKSDASSAPPEKRRGPLQFSVAITPASKPNAPEDIQALNTVLRATPSEKYTSVGSSFFSRELGTPVLAGEGVEILKGCHQSLGLTQMGLSLNIDASARAFYEPVLVTTFAAKYLGLRDVPQTLSDQDLRKLQEPLLCLKVQSSHRGYSKTYKITGFSAQPLNQISVTWDEKTETLDKYYYEIYKKELTHASLPALQVGSRLNYLPMELCTIASGQRYNKELTEKQATTLLNATRQHPLKREADIKQMVKHHGYADDELVRDVFRISVEEELTNIDARVLPPPRLKYHQSGREKFVDPQGGKWKMTNKKFINGGRVDFWTCVNFSSHINGDAPARFCEKLKQMCINKGMVFNENPIIPIVSVSPMQIEATLDDIPMKCTEKKAKLQLLIIILPDENVGSFYGKIKRICETKLGIMSQCVLPKFKNLFQIPNRENVFLENLTLKINVKVGGRNSVLNDAFLRTMPFVSDRHTIIFGADVTHPSSGVDSSPSIAAVVASMDWPEVTKYRGLVSAQARRLEIIRDLYKSNDDPPKETTHSGMVRDLLKAFHEANGCYPGRIIFYRDGVGESQFGQVLLLEMVAIRKACASLEAGYLPPITFIVVQKRHHTRFFPADPSTTDKFGNIPPGTVIDSEICHKTGFDFYLNSHAGVEGTSRPAHYHVLYDENNFTADTIQKLTYDLCYTYVRCTNSASIVPPVYYAHLAAYRARYYISDGGSTSGPSTTGSVGEVPAIKDDVKKFMFYC